MAKLTKSKPGSRIYDPTCGSGSLLIKAGRQVGDNNFSLYGQEANGSTWALAVMNMYLHGYDSAVIRWGDTLRNPKHKEGDALMLFDTVVANPPFHWTNGEPMIWQATLTIVSGEVCHQNLKEIGLSFHI